MQENNNGTKDMGFEQAYRAQKDDSVPSASTSGK
jgi:hypothetical protein